MKMLLKKIINQIRFLFERKKESEISWIPEECIIKKEGDKI